MILPVGASGLRLGLICEVGGVCFLCSPDRGIGVWALSSHECESIRSDEESKNLVSLSSLISEERRYDTEEH